MKKLETSQGLGKEWGRSPYNYRLTALMGRIVQRNLIFRFPYSTVWEKFGKEDKGKTWNKLTLQRAIDKEGGKDGVEQLCIGLWTNCPEGNDGGKTGRNLTSHRATDKSVSREGMQQLSIELQANCPNGRMGEGREGGDTYNTGVLWPIAYQPCT